MKSLIKKIFFVVFCFFILILFVGCTITDVTNEALETTDIYNKSLDAVKAANSYDYEIASKEFIQMVLPPNPSEGGILDEESNSIEKSETETLIRGKLIQKPLSLEMIMKMNVLDQQDALESPATDLDSNSIELKIYMLEGKQYSYFSSWGAWAVQDLREIDIDWENLESINKRSNPMYFLNLLENDLAREAVLETDEQHYILSLQNDEDEFIRRIMEDILGYDTAIYEDIDAALDDIQLSEPNYKIWIDKETYLPTKSYFKYKLTTDIGEYTDIRVHESELSYRNFGAIDKIEIPDEAKNAINMEELLKDNI
ncbi:DUF6612 family protein [Clostridium formicaceticum]|uniref:Uncharacterized protein n=1 Tax=Clostridium formicaceticum TaxID=1497 RepID=A0AAC9RNT9_9CLOT|nr:DUF6612 family protein [Clostridium formicaceticum]AOY74643.1 hypothetical protein BJL90_00930 [Clostridium formicaceticum]ARE89012.1 hypothetical protein CLFO_34180 [Clostridium formicaceticum]